MPGDGSGLGISSYFKKNEQNLVSFFLNKNSFFIAYNELKFTFTINVT